jgi:hypothetical protein
MRLTQGAQMSSPVFGWQRLGPLACALVLLLPAAAAASSPASDMEAHSAPVATTASDTPPHITAKLTSTTPRTKSNWWLAPVNVTFTCTIGSTPIEGSCPSPVTLARGGRRESVTASVTDTDHQKATVTVSRINIDLAGPKVWISGPKANHVYAAHAPAPHCKGSDKLSGIRSCRLKTTTKALKHGERITAVATAVAKSGASLSTQISYEVSAA